MPILEPSNFPENISNKYTLKNNALVQVVKSDWKDRIQTEIGDTKNSDHFFPQIKIGRWGDNEDTNEVNFSMRLKHTEKTPTVEFDGEKTKWKGAKVEAHFYDKPEASENGGHEFEVVLKEKPTTNILEFSIETKGLEFFYQPELTQAEIAEGANRPENVIDSYAVYYKDCPTNKIYRIDESKYTQDELNQMVLDGMHIGIDNKKTGKMEYFKLGKLYKVGKAFHIYRIKATDANGVSVWGKQNIDVVKKLHTIEIPQEFLDGASYPVVIDPTFGYETTGGSHHDVNQDVIVGSVFSGVAGTGVSITVVHFYMLSPSSMTSAKWGIYKHSDLSYITDGKTNTAEPLQFYDFPKTLTFVNPPTFENTDYIIVAWVDGSSLWGLYYDSGDTNQGHYQSVSYATNFPTTLSPTHNSNKYSIYATYTAGGGGVSASVSPSTSTSVSPSSSISTSTSPSVSSSSSISASVSPSISISISPSLSTSISPSLSTSTSPSVSPSISSSSSISTSVSPSVSASISISTSLSISPSISESSSVSASISPSISSSISESQSSSLSPSVSASSSISISSSPSEGYQNYSKGNYLELPINDNDLENLYTEQEVIDVEYDDEDKVGQSATQEYMIHQFINYIGEPTSCELTWKGQSTLAPNLSTIYLQIFNRNLNEWETLVFNNSVNADVDFILSVNVENLTNYKDDNTLISCRVYQLAV